MLYFYYTSVRSGSQQTTEIGFDGFNAWEAKVLECGWSTMEIKITQNHQWDTSEDNQYFQNMLSGFKECSNYGNPPTRVGV